MIISPEKEEAITTFLKTQEAPVQAVPAGQDAI
jgi:hypothetical protein